MKPQLINLCNAVQYNGNQRYCTIDGLKPCQYTTRETCPLYLREVKPKAQKTMEDKVEPADTW